MKLIESIKNLFKSERLPFTISILESIGLMKELAENENGSAFVIQIDQTKLMAKITIPIDVYEIFIDIEFDNKKLSGWVDFYGDTKKEDYKEMLSEIKEVIDKKAQIRIKNDTIYLYKNNQAKQWF